MKEWNYNIDAYGDCVTVHRNIDNTISTVYVDIDSYATRDWTEKQVDEGLPAGDVEWMQEDEPQFTEFGRGAFARLKFDVEDEVASFSGVKVDDLDPDKYVWPAWLRLLTPAERMVANVPGIKHVKDPQETIRQEMGIGESTTVRGLDD